MWILVVIGGLVVVIILYVASRSRYYGRLYSIENFREFYQKLSAAIVTAQCKGQVPSPSPNDGTGFVTTAGLGVAVTCRKSDESNQMVHVSLSQPGQATTHALCARFAFFVVAMFGGIKGELTPYYTDSGVHHLVFRFQTAILQLQDFDTTYARYVSDFKPIPFRHEKIKSEQITQPPRSLGR